MRHVILALCLWLCGVATAQAAPAIQPTTKVFDLPRDPDQLVGGDLLKGASIVVGKVLEETQVGDLAVAKVRWGGARGGAPRYALLIYRTRNGVATQVWKLVEAAALDPEVEGRSVAVAERFIDANNRGDAEAFLALFSPQAKNYRTSGDPDRLGDLPSKSIVDATSRERVYRRMFAAGQQAQVKAVAVIALGDLVISHDLAVLPNGKTLDGMSVYRVRDGLITHDWYVYDKLRD